MRLQSEDKTPAYVLSPRDSLARYAGGGVSQDEACIARRVSQSVMVLHQEPIPVPARCCLPKPRARDMRQASEETLRK